MIFCRKIQSGHNFTHEITKTVNKGTFFWQITVINDKQMKL